MLTNIGLLGRLLPPKNDGVSEDYPLAQSHSGWGSGLSHQQGCHPPSPPNHKGMSNRSGCRILITLITPLRAELTFPWWFLRPIPALSMSMHNLTEFSNSTRKRILLNLFHRCLFWNTLQFMENCKNSANGSCISFTQIPQMSTHIPHLCSLSPDMCTCTHTHTTHRYFHVHILFLNCVRGRWSCNAPLFLHTAYLLKLRKLTLT